MISALSAGAKMASKAQTTATETTPLKMESDSESSDWDDEDSKFEELNEETLIDKMCPKNIAKCLNLCCRMQTLDIFALAYYGACGLVGIVGLLMQAMAISGAEKTELFYFILGTTFIGGIIGIIGEIAWLKLIESLKKEHNEYKKNNTQLETNVNNLRLQINDLKPYIQKLGDDRQILRENINKFKPLKKKLLNILKKHEKLESNESDEQICNNFINVFNHLIQICQNKELAQFIETYYDCIFRNYILNTSNTDNNSDNNNDTNTTTNTNTNTNDSQQLDDEKLIELPNNNSNNNNKNNNNIPNINSNMSESQFMRFKSRQPIKIGKKFEKKVQQRNIFSSNKSSGLFSSNDNIKNQLNINEFVQISNQIIQESIIQEQLQKDTQTRSSVVEFLAQLTPKT